MQKSSSQVSSGNIAPVVMGPQRDTKDVMILAGIVLFLSVLIAAAWFYGQTSEQINITPATEKVENSNVSEIFKQASALNQAEASTTNSTPVTASVAPKSDIIHSDVYFEVGRKGLTDEGKAQLSAQADLLKQHQDYGVLIQGYTDQQGSASYNKTLGLQRAETVKTELLIAGVAEHQMKVVTLGEEGVLCIDNSDTCRHMNRRVHLEIRKIDQEHMATPAVAATSSDPSEAAIDATTKAEETSSVTESLTPLSHEPTPGS
ncbi:MAG: hypothetical protein EWM72_03424 [Nitrospira sp.]|nr:MAG: hypothetical protein EWM72_03424 [Nitrospira sp.]